MKKVSLTAGKSTVRSSADNRKNILDWLAVPAIVLGILGALGATDYYYGYLSSFYGIRFPTLLESFILIAVSMIFQVLVLFSKIARRRSAADIDVQKYWRTF